ANHRVLEAKTWIYILARCVRIISVGLDRFGGCTLPLKHCINRNVYVLLKKGAIWHPRIRRGLSIRVRTTRALIANTRGPIAVPYGALLSRRRPTDAFHSLLRISRRYVKRFGGAGLLSLAPTK
ncbi:hypothetical protein SK128_023293, partial [Halocaridina rubra]